MINHTVSARGFSAWITIDGQPLPAYQEETVEATCSAWIPSSPGRAFSVWWKDDSKARIATSGHVFIDGHDVASAISRPGRTKAVERSGAKTSARRLRPFCFAVLRLTGRLVLIVDADDETVAGQDDATLNDMGTIKIEISRVKLGDEVPFKGYEAQDRGIVHERAKKLGAHCTSYGPSMRAEASRTVAVTTAPYDPDMPGPYVTFIFHYRSEDILRANGVIGNGERKRHSPGADDELIEISDSDSEHETENGPARKRPRTETDNASSEVPDSAERPSEQRDAVDKPMSEQSDVVDKSGLLDSADKASELLDDEMASSELGLGASSLLQSASETVGLSQVMEESQTQPDEYTQIGFGAPPTLLRDGIHEAEDAPNSSLPQISEPEGHDAEESQPEAEGATRQSKE